MSPRKFLDGDDHKQQQSRSGVVINGPRPTPLKVKQESHTIHKQQHQQQQIKKPPIIIYTYSPEVIHTKPHDFMALVQKLTGHASEKQVLHKTLKQDDRSCDRRDNGSNNSNDSGVTHDQKDKIIKDKSPMFDEPSSPYVADIPLFTPNSSDYFCSSTRPFFRFSDMVSSSPSMSTSLSPGSLVELLKGLPEY